MRSVALLIVLLSLSPVSAQSSDWDGKWFTSSTGASTIELPSFLEGARDFMEYGVDHGTQYVPTNDSSFWVEQYWNASSARPYAWITERNSDKTFTPTYTVDRPTFGVLSGIVDGRPQTAFYEICRLDGANLDCVEMGWNRSEQGFIEPIIERIVKSFRH